MMEKWLYKPVLEQLNSMNLFGLWGKQTPYSRELIIKQRCIIWKLWKSEVLSMFILGYYCRKPRDTFISFKKCRFWMIPSYQTLYGLLQL